MAGQPPWRSDPFLSCRAFGGHSVCPAWQVPFGERAGERARVGAAPRSWPLAGYFAVSRRASTCLECRASTGPEPRDRKRVVSGKSVYVRVDHGGRQIIKKKQKIKENVNT